MKPQIVVLGAGFGGLEVTSVIAEALGDEVELTLIDKSDSFYFGFSKLEVMFGRATPDSIKVAYRSIAKPGVVFRQELVTGIDPEKRRVVTDRRSYDAEILVVALGADYDVGATPGLAEGGNEFYSLSGAERLRGLLPSFSKGRAVVGVTSTPFKCPPAPSEAALMLHEYLSRRGVRAACEITLVMPFGAPIPPSPEMSKALLTAFAERNITFISKHEVRALHPIRRVATLDDGMELPYDLFLGIPKHRVPAAVAASGMTEDGWIQVEPTNLRTRFPGVYAVGDVTESGVPKAGMFAESAAQVAAASIIADIKGTRGPSPYAGTGACYVDFGTGLVGRVDMNFLSGPYPRGIYGAPSSAIFDEKYRLASVRRARWFGSKGHVVRTHAKHGITPRRKVGRKADTTPSSGSTQRI